MNPVANARIVLGTHRPGLSRHIFHLSLAPQPFAVRAEWKSWKSGLSSPAAGCGLRADVRGGREGLNPGKRVEFFFFFSPLRGPRQNGKAARNVSFTAAGGSRAKRKQDASINSHNDEINRGRLR